MQTSPSIRVRLSVLVGRELEIGHQSIDIVTATGEPVVVRMEDRAEKYRRQSQLPCMAICPDAHTDVYFN